MSFFVRSRNPGKLTDRVGSSSTRNENKQGRRNGPSGARKRKGTTPSKHAPPSQKKPYKVQKPEEEITSESEVEDEIQNDDAAALVNSSDDDSETEQQARIRVAKEQIQSLKRRLIEKHGAVDDEHVGELLRQQELVEEGKVLRNLFTQEFADKQFDVKVILRGNIIKSPLTSIQATDENIYASTKSGTVVAYNVQTNTRTHVTLKQRVTSMAVSRSHVAVCTPSAIHLLSPSNLSITHTFSNSRNAVSLTLTPDTLFSTHKDRTVKLWNVQERAYVESLFGHQDIPTCVHASNQKVVTAGGFDKTVRVWKIEEESQLVYNWDQDIIDVVCVLSNGFFVAGSCSGNIGLFSFGRKKPLHVVTQAHGVDEANVPRWITALHGIGDLVCSGSDTGLVNVWRVLSRKLEFVRGVQIAPRGVIIGIQVITGSEEQQPDDDSNNKLIRVVVGVGTEYRNGRWGGTKLNCSSVFVFQ